MVPGLVLLKENRRLPRLTPKMVTVVGEGVGIGMPSVIVTVAERGVSRVVGSLLFGLVSETVKVSVPSGTGLFTMEIWISATVSPGSKKTLKLVGL